MKSSSQRKKKKKILPKSRGSLNPTPFSHSKNDPLKSRFYVVETVWIENTFNHNSIPEVDLTTNSSESGVSREQESLQPTQTRPTQKAIQKDKSESRILKVRGIL
jgi:hypothetical protein